jgi:hypothetical protein
LRAGREKEMKEDGGSDVVGDIPDDLQSGHLFDQIGRGDLENVLVQDPDPRHTPMSSFQLRRKLPIQFHQNEAPAAAYQVPGKSPLPWPDLEDLIVGPDVQSFNDLPLEISVNEEILSE